MDNIDINIDYYKILECNRKATLEEIKKNYKRLALKYHPDKNSDSNATEMFNQISNAYQILSNGELREKYDLLGRIPKEYSLKSPDEVFSDFLSKLDPKLNQFIKHTMTNLHKSICDSNNKTIWDVLSSLDTEQIINSGSNLVKSILNRDRKRLPKFLKAKQVDLSMEQIEPGANCIQIDYDICKNFSHIMLSVGGQKFLLETAYDIHTVHINNIEYEFQLEYIIPNFLDTINNYDIVLYYEINYKYIYYPFSIDLGGVSSGLKYNIKLGGYSNCVLIRDLGFYNPYKSTNGNLYIYFIFTGKEDSNYIGELLDSIPQADSLDILKYIKN